MTTRSLSRSLLAVFTLLPLLDLSTAHAIEDEDDSASKVDKVTCYAHVLDKYSLDFDCGVDRESKPWIDERWIQDETYRRATEYCRKLWKTDHIAVYHKYALCYNNTCGALVGAVH